MVAEVPPPSPFALDIAISSWCAGCKQDRELPDATDVALRNIGGGAVVLTGDPCTRCGRTGIVAQAGVKQQK